MKYSEDAIAIYHDWVDRPPTHRHVTFEDAVRKDIRWKKVALPRQR